MKEKQSPNLIDAATKEIIIKSVAEEGTKVSDIAGRYDVGPSMGERIPRVTVRLGSRK